MGICARAAIFLRCPPPPPSPTEGGGRRLWSGVCAPGAVRRAWLCACRGLVLDEVDIEDRRLLRHDQQMPTSDTFRVPDLLLRDQLRWRAMGMVESLGLPQGCIGAGFVRNLVWDHFHGGSRDCREEDVDVLFYDPSRTDAAYDTEIEATLRESAPDLKWSVKNQARMHLRNHDAPYLSVEDAMRFWPETATAVAAIRSGNECIIIAPFGLLDLQGLILRPTSSAPHKVSAFLARVTTKNWRMRWPKVRVVDEYGQD